jgi:glycosyltransferase involved in cell wall biosynthesis
MSYGRPVLVSDIPENREAVGAGGFLFKSKDKADLREKLIYLLANPEISRLSGEANRQRVEANYNWGNITEDILKVYSSALKEKAAGKKYFSRLRLLGRFVGFLF